MKKRTIIFRTSDPVKGQGWTTEDSRLKSYDTALYGWTLTGCLLTDPEQKTQFVEKSGGDGAWDLSTALTDGIPLYRDRTLTATLECSEGTREERQRLISAMVNLLDGFEWEIILPDHPDHFLKGRARIGVNQNSLAYAMVTVTATCEPWFYSDRETTWKLSSVAGSWGQHLIFNNGRRVVCPTITAEGNITLACYEDVKTQKLVQIEAPNGTPISWPSFVLAPGGNALLCTGAGSIKVTFREAVLL